ncbi:interferon-induced GTP-binding protein Mx [Achlya hypogyna]|uniref:Interferon-induced GTP-binding protein Mx n=1 Tax=Achlya hypogyna TaxID=1202772 RepID=A0A1V9YTG5_ACHHY|nr:interferon-induced GTP-binding protein Mx [Achlya hypogyna]
MTANRGDELPLFVSYQIFSNVIGQRYISKWRAPMQELFCRCHDLLRALVERAITASNASKSVQVHLNRVGQEVIAQFAMLTRLALDKMMETESRPYTMNHYLYDVFMKLRAKSLFDGLDTLSGGNDTTLVPMGAVKALLKSRAGIGRTSNEKQQAIELHMAMKAYIKVAKKRFTDAIPMLLQTTFLKPVQEELRRRFTTDAGDELLERLLVDSVADEAKRAKLTTQLRALETAKLEISKS